MKAKLLGTLTALFLTTTAHAALLTCYGDSGYSTAGYKQESISGDCTAHIVDPKADSGWRTQNFFFNVEGGYGLGLGMSSEGDGFTMLCPTALVENLSKAPFYGVKADAGFFLGANVAVFANKRLGSCVMIGLKGLGIGASVVGSKLTFRNQD